MATIEELRETIGSTEDLHSVVRTMKAMAAVRIRQYQKAVESLEEYSRTVEMGLQILLRQRYFAEQPIVPSSVVEVAKPRTGQLAAIIFGSDQGLCGQFNQQIALYALEKLDELEVKPEERLVATVGERLVPILENQGVTITEQFSLPTSATGITAKVQEILLAIEEWESQQQVDRVMLFYNQPRGGAAYRSQSLKLLPLDRQWLRSLQHQEWATSVLPTFTMDWQPLFSALIREYLFVSLYRTFAASLASENASRLAAMQSAQKNIEERLDELTAQYRRQRQTSITAELLDVVAGFEALS